MERDTEVLVSGSHVMYLSTNKDVSDTFNSFNCVTFKGFVTKPNSSYIILYHFPRHMGQQKSPGAQYQRAVMLVQRIQQCRCNQAAQKVAQVCFNHSGSDQMWNMVTFFPFISRYGFCWTLWCLTGALCSKSKLYLELINHMSQKTL